MTACATAGQRFSFDGNCPIQSKLKKPVRILYHGKINSDKSIPSKTRSSRLLSAFMETCQTFGVSIGATGRRPETLGY